MEEKRIEKKQELFQELLALKERVFCVCLGFSKNFSDAEDLTQESYLKALTKMETLKDWNFLQTWLFRIVKNTCLDYQKKMRWRRHQPLSQENIPGHAPDPQDILEHTEDLKKLKGLISELPGKQKEVFVLREYGNFSYKEISDILKIKHGTVMSRLNRAKHALSELMREPSNG